MNPPLATYIPRVLAGDRAATVEFSNALTKFAWCYLGPWRFPLHEREALAVNCCTKVVLKLSSYRKGKFEAWVKVILMRLACDLYWELHARSLDSMDDDRYTPGGELDLFCTCDHPDAAAALHKAIELLPRADAIILDARYRDAQLEFKEIAAILKMKTNSVIKRHDRALEKLLMMLQDHPDIQVWQSRRKILVSV